jgi:hypothetical protein
MAFSAERTFPASSTGGEESLSGRGADAPVAPPPKVERFNQREAGAAEREGRRPAQSSSEALFVRESELNSSPLLANRFKGRSVPKFTRGFARGSSLASRQPATTPPESTSGQQQQFARRSSAEEVEEEVAPNQKPTAPPQQRSFNIGQQRSPARKFLPSVNSGRSRFTRFNPNQQQ